MDDNVQITFSECEVGEPELLQRDMMMGWGNRTLLRYRNDRVGWLMPMTPALERLRQVDCQKFKAGLSYRVQTMSQEPQLNKEGLIIPQVQYV